MSKRQSKNEFEKDEWLDERYNTPLSYKIVNVVSTVIVDIEKEIDLNQIIRKCQNVEYNPSRFPGLVMRIENPCATILLFSTGRMVIAGLKKASNAPKIVQKAIKKIQKAGFKVGNPKITIQNIVATGDLNIRINLDKATIVAENVMYEPEVFPGLIYRMQEPKIVFLIFSTGKIVCLGAKKIEIIKEAIIKLNKQVHEYGVIINDLELDNFENTTFF